MSDLKTETTLPNLLHFELVTDLDNVGQFVGQRVNAGGARFVAMQSEDFRRMATLASESRTANAAYHETRATLQRMFEISPELVRVWYAASLDVTKVAKQKRER